MKKIFMIMRSLRTFLPFSIAAIALVVGMPAAHAQSLWEAAYYGMSQQEVTSLYTQAAPTRLGYSVEVEDIGLVLAGVSLGDRTVELRFIFKDARLFAINFRTKIYGDSAMALEAYDSVRAFLRSMHPKQHEVSTDRVKGQFRRVGDKIVFDGDALGKVNSEWLATDETAVSINLTQDGVSSFEVSGMISVAGHVLAARKARQDGEVQDAFYARKLAEAALVRKSEEERYTAEIRAWDGKPIRDYIHSHGAPTSRLKLDKNETVYVWEEGTEEMRCRTSIFTNASGRIINWQWKGNTCRKK